VGPKADLDVSVKSRPHQRSILGPPSQLACVFVNKLQTVTADLLRRRPDTVGLPFKRRLSNSL